MGGMGGVFHDTGSFTGASCKENVLQFPYQTVMQLVSTLSIVPLCDEDGWRET